MSMPERTRERVMQSVVHHRDRTEVSATARNAQSSSGSFSGLGQNDAAISEDNLRGEQVVQRASPQRPINGPYPPPNVSPAIPTAPTEPVTAASPSGPVRAMTSEAQAPPPILAVQFSRYAAARCSCPADR